MVLLKGTNVPDGAVRLTESEALEYQTKVVNQWTPAREMWPLKYGSFFLGGMTVATGVFLNECYRKFCKLPRAHSRITILLPLSAISAMGTTFLQFKYITDDIFLNKTPCLLCVQWRSALIQGFVGTVYPALFLSLGSLMMAQRLHTIYTPPVDKEPKKFFKLCQEMVQKKSNLLVGLLIAQVAVAFAVTYFQKEAAFKLHNPSYDESDDDNQFWRLQKSNKEYKSEIRMPKKSRGNNKELETTTD